MSQHSRLPWTQPRWFDEASAWITATLRARGIAVRGPIVQVHTGPWSAVLRIPSDDGTVYFKAAAPALAHEAALTAALSRWWPEGIPRLLAAVPERGWLLMADGGVPLRARIAEDRDLDHWHRILPRYAELQIVAADHLAEVLALGAFDRRLAVLPVQYARLVEEAGAPDGLDPGERRALRALAPRLVAACEHLRGVRVPETLHHDDLHDGNVFVRDDRYLFLDWGEACAAHPFFTLVVALRGIAYRFGLPDGAAVFDALRDRYLEPWTRFEPMERLRAACALAQPLGMVCRALTWQHIVSTLDAPLREEYGEAVPRWLRAFLEAAPALG